MSANTNKTRATDASVEAYFAAIDDEVRREDCRKLAAMMSKASGEPAAMWGESIVGFGRYRYRYESGREGDWCRIGFSSRKGDISLYLACDDFPEREALLARLGRHKTGKACVYVRRLADVDQDVLEKLIEGSLVAVSRMYG